MTAYFKLNGWEDPLSYSGFTLVSRSNHHLYKEDPCMARSYYCRLWKNGEIGFQQEYRHGSGTSYSPSNRVKLYNGDIPKGKWIGMKFCIFDKDGQTFLQVYVDEDEGRNGGNWQLKHQLNAMQFGGNDPCNAPKPIPDGGCSFIRTDRANTVQVKWASIREITPVASPPPKDDDDEDIVKPGPNLSGSDNLLWILLLIPVILLLLGVGIMIYLKYK